MIPGTPAAARAASSAAMAAVTEFDELAPPSVTPQPVAARACQLGQRKQSLPLQGSREARLRTHDEALAGTVGLHAADDGRKRSHCDTQPQSADTSLRKLAAPGRSKAGSAASAGTLSSGLAVCSRPCSRVLSRQAGAQQRVRTIVRILGVHSQQKAGRQQERDARLHGAQVPARQQLPVSIADAVCGTLAESSTRRDAGAAAAAKAASCLLAYQASTSTASYQERRGSSETQLFTAYSSGLETRPGVEGAHRWPCTLWQGAEPP